MNTKSLTKQLADGLLSVGVRAKEAQISFEHLISLVSHQKVNLEDVLQSISEKPRPERAKKR